MKIRKWEEFYRICKEYLDLIIEAAEDSIVLSRDAQEKFEFYARCIKDLFTLIYDNWDYIECTPDFFNIETTDEDKEKWKDDNEVCTFEGMWEFFGYRIPVYVDDYGQQMYIKFEMCDGKIIEIPNGSYNISSDGCAYQLLEHIEKDIIEKLKRYIKKVSGIENLL